MKNKLIVLIMLLIYTVIVFLPPVIHGYVYPNNSDDSAVHLYYFDKLQQGQYIGYVYLGRQIIGYPMIWINSLTGLSLDTQFLWINFIALWLVGISVFILITKLVNWKAGLISIPLVMFASPIILNLYDTGGIFDLLTVGVIVPLGLLCCIYSFTSKKLKWIIPTIALIVLAVVVHSIAIFRDYPVKQPATPISEFISILLGYPVLIILVFSLVYIGLSKIKFELRDKVLIVLFILLFVGLSVMAFTQLSAWATRFATDLAIIISIFTAYLIGIVIKNIKTKQLMWVSILFILGVSSPVLLHCYQYNNAVKPVDLKAIEYVNSLPGEYYSCSYEINTLIYKRFINKTYKEGELPYIKRSVPMTSGTTPNTSEYIWGDLPLPDTSHYVLDKTFIDGKIEIDIYSDGYIINPNIDIDVPPPLEINGDNESILPKSYIDWSIID